MQIDYNLVGLGYIGKIHLMAMNNFNLLNLPIKSNIIKNQLVTRDPVKRLEAAQLLGFEKTVDVESWEIDSNKAQLIDICSPNINHKDLVIEAIEKNIHVYCEKPLSMNGEETREILNRHKKSKSRIQICYIMRYIPAFAKARAAIKNNVIGDISSFRIEYYHSSYLNPDKPYAWRLDEKISGGGALYDLGSHAFDVLQFLIEPIKEVMCFTDTIVKERKDSEGNYKKVTVDDWALTHVHTVNDIKGTVEVSRIAVGDDGIRVRIYGTEGSLMINVNNNPIDVMYYDYLGNNIHLDEKYYTDDSYYKHLLKFYPTPKMSQGFFLDAHTASLASFIYQIENNTNIEGVPSINQCKNLEAILTACKKSSISKYFENIDI
ncbi:oxidoreductase [Vallitalea longa]|uniref:Oxidoreductase n=1 Tax=Vallitalea longa TaxID=2936439 RepID=A0A9W6DG02_9FIRM|nr:Gfo/Idh/MocA family oxidoreductase [Vallitalea longa]GKX29958.1 oxidoreductase [Vallitalea longa]